MDTKSAIEQLLDAVDKTSNVNDILIKNARAEVTILKNKNLRQDAKKTLDSIIEIVSNVAAGGAIKSAKKKYTDNKEDFDKFVKMHLKGSNKEDMHEAQYPYEPKPDYDSDQWGNKGKDRLRHYDVQHNTYPDSTKVNTAAAEEYERQRSQKASQAMRHNNPEIADLSDTNRPTKIAERFTELYDNEWTSAFEILSEKKKTEEKKITQLLLDIVEEAYSFSKKEAEQQIQVMNLALMNIMEYGEAKRRGQNEDLPKDVCLLVQYRKEHAGRSVKRIQNNFEEVLKRKCNEVMKQKPSNDSAMAKYGRKAVELTWWMCVQEPPVYMVSTKGGFNPDFYKAYTKSGKNPDFFVWPPLKLHDGGGLMTKGVVQYK